MRRSRLRRLSFVASLLLLAAFFLPFVEVGGLFDDVWDDDGRKAETSAQGSHLQRRASAAPESPEGSSPPGVFAIALGLATLEPRFQSEPGVVPFLPPRPARPSCFPRDLERGPPART